MYPTDHVDQGAAFARSTAGGRLPPAGRTRGMDMKAAGPVTTRCPGHSPKTYEVGAARLEEPGPDMIDEPETAATLARERLALRVVDPARARTLVIPCAPDGSAAYRGLGPRDYTCGACGRELAIGVRSGMFQGLAFACACGALNHVQ
jgi:hypothetical protein